MCHHLKVTRQDDYHEGAGTLGTPVSPPQRAAPPKVERSERGGRGMGASLHAWSGRDPGITTSPDVGMLVENGC